MNTLVDIANRWGQGLVELAGPLVVQSSLLIVALLVLDYALRRHVRAVVRYALWLLVLVKLVLPPSFALPTGLGYWLPGKPPPPRPAFSPGTVIVRYGDAPITLPGIATKPAVIRLPSLDRHAVVMLSWLAGCVVLLGLLLHRSGVVRCRVEQAQEAAGELWQLLETCRRELDLRAPVRLKLSDSSLSPAVCGLWRPVILLPRPLADKLSTLQLRAVLLHELAHVQRGDVWVNYAQTLLQIAYWWHPLVWLANAYIRRVREEAVDERVMVALGHESDTYPGTLIEVAKHALARPLLSLGLVGILESRSSLKRRIHRLLNQPVPRSSRLSLAGLALCVVLGALLLPMARGQRRPAASPMTQPSPLDATTNRVTTAAAPLDMQNAKPVRAEQASDWPGVSYEMKEPAGRSSWAFLLPGETNQTVLANFDWLLGELESIGKDIRRELQTLDEIEQKLAIPATKTVQPENLATSDDADLRRLAVAKRSLYQKELLQLLVREKMVRALWVPEAFQDATLILPAVAKRLVALREKLESAQARADSLRQKLGLSASEFPAELSHMLAQTPRRYRPYAQAWREAGFLQEAHVALDGLHLALSKRGEASAAAAAAELLRARAELEALLSQYTDQHPRVKAARERIKRLEAEQSAPSAAQTVLTVTVSAKEPFFHLDSRAVTLEELKKELEQAVAKHPDVALSLRADKEAAFERIVQVTDAAQAAGIPRLSSRAAPPKSSEQETATKPQTSHDRTPVLSDIPLLSSASRSEHTDEGRMNGQRRLDAVRENTDEPPQLFTRRFKVDPNTFLHGLERATGLEIDGTKNQAEALRKLFTAAGVDFSPPTDGTPGKSLFFSDRTGMLLVRATANDLELIELALLVLDAAPPQVTIEARIAEIPDEAAAKLVTIPLAEAPNEPWPFEADVTGVNQILALAQTNMNVRVDSSRPKLQMGFFTEPQEKQLRQTMEQQAGVDVLAALRVTTLSARQAQILARSSMNVITGVKVPSTEANYVTEQVNLGPVVDVTPIVQADGVNIELLARLELTEFLGYDEGPSGLKGHPLPRFRVRELGARAKVKDGQTLALVSEPFERVEMQKDKVPVLGDVPGVGRLFRSETTTRTQRRLVLLLTPTITDPAGNRVHPPE